MKAILVEKIGGELKCKDHHLREPKEDQVLIDVKYAGVNFPDTLIVEGKYQFQPELPFSPGGEVSGVVKEVGAGVGSLKVGDRVVSGTSWGGFAEQAMGFACNTHKLPEGVGFKESAAVLMTHGTVFHALKDRGHLQKGETLVVLGASGGVGVAAIQLGKAFGAQVIACASSTEKLEFCKKIGADHTFLYEEETIKKGIKELTNGKGADVIFDPVGGRYTEQAFRAIAPMGRYLIIGFAAGQVPAIPMNLPLLKSASLVGVFWGNFFRNYPNENQENVRQILNLLKNEVIHPHIDVVLPLTEATKALKYLKDRKVMGKVLLEIQ
ncbi:MAG: NADPH:quinone oxidoreductase family protein [Bacteroidota bacterium]